MAVSREVRVKFLPSDKITIETAYNYRMTTLNRPETFGIETGESDKPVNKRSDQVFSG